MSRWTEAEDRVVRELAGRVPAGAIADRLPNRSARAVGRRLRALGLDGRLYGEAHQNARTSNLQRAMIITLKQSGYTATEIKRAFNLSIPRTTINDICRPGQTGERK